MCKNNPTFSNDGSCSCRKAKHFLRRKGGYCHSSKSTYGGRGTCNENKMFPVSISSSFVRVYERQAGASLLLCAGTTESSKRSAQLFPLLKWSSAAALSKVEAGLTSLLSPSASPKAPLSLQRSQRRLRGVRGGRGGRAELFCRFPFLPPSPQTGNNSQGAI